MEYAIRMLRAKSCLYRSQAKATEELELKHDLIVKAMSLAFLAEEIERDRTPSPRKLEHYSQLAKSALYPEDYEEFELKLVREGTGVHDQLPLNRAHPAT